MTIRSLLLALLLTTGVACGAPGHSATGGGGWGGSAAGGRGGGAGNPDAAVVIKLDAASQTPSNLATDAPVFNWDVRGCSNCDAAPEVSAAGGSSSGGSSGSGGNKGSGGMSGSGGMAGSGGAMTGSGGMTTSGSGGKAGVGGFSSMGGSPGTGGHVGGMTGTGTGGSTGRGGSTGSTDGGLPPPDTISDSGIGGSRDAGRDTIGGDLAPRCNARIRAVVPSTTALDAFPLAAGANTQVVLRAEVVSGGPAAPVWTWHAYRDNSPIGVNPGQSDAAEAAFAITQEGTYTFTAVDNTTCSTSVSRYVQADSARHLFDDDVILRAAPPPDGNFPVQTGPVHITNGDVLLLKGAPVFISPSVGQALISAYVRINTSDGDLVADGLADPQARFSALLLPTNATKQQLRYDVLVVPIDGADGTPVAATAPQLFANRLPSEINELNAQQFPLSGGISVYGSTRAADGTPVSDARVILTNRNPNPNPSDPAAAKQLMFSSVGRTDGQGNFVLHAQPGDYWVSVSPPAGQGLAEALAPSPITISSNNSGLTLLTFTWNAAQLTSLTLDVVDMAGDRLDARVRLTSAQATAVGSLQLGSGDVQQAQGNVRAEASTVNGSVTFTNLPADTTYSVLVVAAKPGPGAATTVASVFAPAGGSEQQVQVSKQGRINGQLLSSLPGAADWSQVSVVAYDRSADTPESPQAVGVNPDGSFVVAVSPGRPYVVVAMPSVASGLARTFVGPGALESSEFTIAQKVPAIRTYSARVVDENGNGVAGTALQTFCEPSWPGCVDATIPLAETTTEFGGFFSLTLAAP